MIKHAVEDFRKMGAEGVVFGVLKPDGTLNMEQMKELMEAAGDMSVTLHRAFDVCVDPIETMEQAISLGINTILTSGQRNVCLQGADLLRDLVEKSQGRITIQAGSGVGAEVIRQLYPLTGVRAYHMTGKRVIDSEMQFRKDGVNMGLPMLSEYEIWRTEADNIRAAKKVLEDSRIPILPYTRYKGKKISLSLGILLTLQQQTVLPVPEDMNCGIRPQAKKGN